MHHPIQLHLVLALFGTSFFNYFVWQRMNDEVSVHEMRIWSIMLITSDLKWCIHFSRSLFSYFKFLMRVTAVGPERPFHLWKTSFLRSDDNSKKENALQSVITIGLSHLGRKRRKCETIAWLLLVHKCAILLWVYVLWRISWCSVEGACLILQDRTVLFHDWAD